MEVELDDGRPGTPVRMRGAVAAFVEVGAPALTRQVAQRPHVPVNERQRDAKLDGPIGGANLFRLDDGGQGSAPEHLRAILRGCLGVGDETVAQALMVGDVVDEQRAAAVELEVHVAAIGVGLDEELDGAVGADRVVVLRVDAAHVVVVARDRCRESLRLSYRNRACVAGRWSLPSGRKCVMSSVSACAQAGSSQSAFKGGSMCV